MDILFCKMAYVIDLKGPSQLQQIMVLLYLVHDEVWLLKLWSSDFKVIQDLTFADLKKPSLYSAG